MGVGVGCCCSTFLSENRGGVAPSQSRELGAQRFVAIAPHGNQRLATPSVDCESPSMGLFILVN